MIFFMQKKPLQTRVMRIRRIRCKKYMKRLKCYELISYFCNCKISPCSGNNVCMCKFSRIIPIILVSVLTLCGGGIIAYQPRK